MSKAALRTIMEEAGGSPAGAVRMSRNEAFPQTERVADYNGKISEQPIQDNVSDVPLDLIDGTPLQKPEPLPAENVSHVSIAQEQSWEAWEGRDAIDRELAYSKTDAGVLFCKFALKIFITLRKSGKFKKLTEGKVKMLAAAYAFCHKTKTQKKVKYNLYDTELMDLIVTYMADIKFGPLKGNDKRTEQLMMARRYYMALHAKLGRGAERMVKAATDNVEAGLITSDEASNYISIADRLSQLPVAPEN